VYSERRLDVSVADTFGSRICSRVRYHAQSAKASIGTRWRNEQIQGPYEDNVAPMSLLRGMEQRRGDSLFVAVQGSSLQEMRCLSLNSSPQLKLQNELFSLSIITRSRTCPVLLLEAQNSSDCTFLSQFLQKKFNISVWTLWPRVSLSSSAYKPWLYRARRAPCIG